MGIILGDKTEVLKDSTLYVIGAILAISTSSFKFREFTPTAHNSRQMAMAILLNYVLLNVLILVPAWFFVPENIWFGFIIIAATPPAIAIIPFTINLDGDKSFSIIGVFAANVLGIFITPGILILFLGNSGINPFEILLMMVKILILPLLFSRVLRLKPINGFIEKNRGNLVDIGFFIVATTVIGLSRDLLFENPYLLIIPAIILVTLQFGVSYLTGKVLMKFGLNRRSTLSVKMLLVIKNAGFSAIIAFNLFPNNSEVLIPAAILSTLLPIYYIFESLQYKSYLKKNDG
jgi:BASS family bile acid:Na+ symporter